MIETNDAQRRQSAGDFQLIIPGADDWKSFLGQPIHSIAPWVKVPGDKNPVLLPHLEQDARANNDSVERIVVCALLTMGFKLEELEVDIVGKMSSPMWGRCVWYADHPKYAEPIPAFFTGMNFKPIFYHAMFRTEHAGDQHYGLYSTQLAMGGWTLLHKTLLYRKVRFSAPSESEARAAA